MGIGWDYLFELQQCLVQKGKESSQAKEMGQRWISTALSAEIGTHHDLSSSADRDHCNNSVRVNST
jgi:hypothetical protein